MPKLDVGPTDLDNPVVQSNKPIDITAMDDPPPPTPPPPAYFPMIGSDRSDHDIDLTHGTFLDPTSVEWAELWERQSDHSVCHLDDGFSPRDQLLQSVRIWK